MPNQTRSQSDGAEMLLKSTSRATIPLPLNASYELNLYNVHYDADPDNGNTIGLCVVFGGFASYSGLAEFEKVYAPYAADQKVLPSQALLK